MTKDTKNKAVDPDELSAEELKKLSGGAGISARPKGGTAFDPTPTGGGENDPTMSSPSPNTADRRVSTGQG